jgi:tRNA dimethylallyltransferase
LKAQAGGQNLIVVAGATGSGKSALAVEAALVLDGEIVNCDSMQLYRRLNIGTAKPGERERSLVPHHLYDVIEPDEVYSAGRYMTEAREICREIAGRNRTPIVVGGAGLYLRALLEGVFEGPGRSDALRRRLHALADRAGVERLYRLLHRRDAEAAARIQPADRVRIVRALEVYFATGRPISRLQPSRQPLAGFRIVKLGLNLPRAELYARIDRRVETMFREGLVEEVAGLLDEGYAPELKAFEALGYRAVVKALRGELSLDEAVELTKRDTRRYAKRQLTWFKREKDMQWIEGAGEDPQALAALLERARR